ncbi:MAG: hypothetical protein IPN49_10090 [Saprospiraceae bacterium]|nr:hypothetical protein [Saprospiraceae bacterium]
MPRHRCFHKFFDEIKTDTDSVAGIFLEKWSAIPDVGQEISHNGVTLRIDSTSKKRIERISVIIEN